MKGCEYVSVCMLLGAGSFAFPFLFPLIVFAFWGSLQVFGFCEHFPFSTFTLYTNYKF